jgi:hypothetical protein
MIIALPFLAARSSAEPPAAIETGIASRYPADRGIENDPAVLLVEDFEDDPVVVEWMEDGGWFGLKYGPGLGSELVQTVPAAGERCLQYNLETGKRTSGGGMFHKIPPSNVLYYRYYRRFEKDWVWPDGYGPHDAMMFGGEFQSPTHTELNVYCDFWKGGETIMRIRTRLYPELEDVHKAWLEDTWKAFGKPRAGGGAIAWNVSEPDQIVPGEWHCFEFMVRLPPAGQQNGTVRLWVNGKLVGEHTDVPMIAPGHEDILINKVFLAPYFHPGSPRDQKHWADQIVIATDYIGPIQRQ